MPQKVVIIGGGPGGATVAKDLQKDFDVTLIDSKEYFDILWGFPRALVDPSVAPRVYFPHSSYLPQAQLVRGVVARASPGEVTLQDGRAFPFDFLVVASGMGLAEGAPATAEEKVAQVEEEHRKLQGAERVLVVGGGPTGVELAAEVLTDFPSKKVTLVHGGARLLEFVGEKAAAVALQWLKAQGAEVVLNDRIEDLSSDKWGTSGTFRTKGGKEIETDYVCVAVGRRPAASWLNESFPDATSTSFLDVDDSLRVTGYSNIFALGDIANLKEMKLGYTAKNQAHMLAGNIRAVSKGSAKLAKYTPGPAVGLVSLGRKNGVAQLPFGTFSGWFPAWMKSKDMFIGKTRGDLGLPA